MTRVVVDLGFNRAKEKLENDRSVCLIVFMVS